MDSKTLENLSQEDLLHVDEVLGSFPKLKLLLRAEWGEDSDLELYWEPEAKVFLEKGPFGRWGAPQFRIRRDIQSTEEWEKQQQPPHPDGRGKIVRINRL
jgi:hypothetical protein